MFSTYAEPQARRPETVAPPARDMGYSQPKPPPQAPPAGSGGLTQLLRTLDQPAQSSTPSSAWEAQTPNAQGFPPAGLPAAGFPPAGQAPMYTPPPVAPSGAGPSEFTRIVTASALREAGLRGPSGGGAPAEAPAAAAGGSPLGVTFTPPSMSMPHMPAMPSAGSGAAPHFAPPAMPGMPGASGGGVHFTGPAMPSAPAVPQLKAPELKVEAPAAGKMQQMLPLLLILVIFLLVAILVAVVLLMKK